jgi:predicted enzyme related to lactoylglutathione lyase
VIAQRRRAAAGGVSADQEKSVVMQLGMTEVGRFCWLDLAASDADRAKAFYGGLLGWQAQEQAANNGSFIRMRLSDKDVGSIYQLRKAQIERGTPSHWTPYIRVDDLDGTVKSVDLFGGKVIIRPFIVTGIARIALIADSVGAHVGLWEPIAVKMKAIGHAQDA